MGVAGMTPPTPDPTAHTLIVTVTGANWADIEEKVATIARRYFLIGKRGRNAETDAMVLEGARVEVSPSFDGNAFHATVQVTR